MPCDTKCCFIGNGKVYMRPTIQGCGENPNPLRPVGNVSQLDIGFETTEESLPNLEDGTGGKSCSLERIEAVRLTMAMNCFKGENVKLALLGEITDVESGTATNEEHIAHGDCSFIPTEHLIDRTQTVTVTDNTTPTPVTFDAGDDYIVRDDGIYIPEGSAIVDLTVVRITYQYLDQQEIDIAQQATQEYEVHISGINAYDKKPFSETFYRVKFGPTDVFSLINTTFANFTVTGELLKDDCHLDSNGDGKRSTMKLSL